MEKEHVLILLQESRKILKPSLEKKKKREQNNLNIYAWEGKENVISPREKGKQILELHTFLLHFILGSNVYKLCYVDKRDSYPPTPLKHAFAESTEDMHWSIAAIGGLFQSAPLSRVF